MRAKGFLRTCTAGKPSKLHGGHSVVGRCSRSPEVLSLSVPLFSPFVGPWVPAEHNQFSFNAIGYGAE